MARFLEIKDYEGNKKIINVEQIAYMALSGPRLSVWFVGANSHIALSSEALETIMKAAAEPQTQSAE